MEFINNDTETKESGYNSFEGKVLRGLILCERIGNTPLEVFRTPTNIIRKITIREIAQKVNDNLHTDGELSQWDEIETHKVIYALKTLGITYIFGVGAGHNQSTIVPTTILRTS